MKLFTAYVFAALAALAVYSLPVVAAPVTWDFSGTGNNIGNSVVFSSGSETLTATALNTQSGGHTHNTPQIHQHTSGIGVSLGGFDSSQLDNLFHDEAIVFDFGSLYSVSSIRITSAGGGFFSSPDDYRIYGSSDASVLACATGGLACLSNISSILLSGSGNGTFSISGIFKFIVVAGVTGGFDDDFRIRSLTAMAVPVPAALPLFATGLAALGFAVHRRRRRRKVAQG